MRLELKKPYLSIDSLNDVELPNFTVLTGVNGSGKTHLLEAIENQSLIIDNNPELVSLYFNYHTFYLENEAEFNAMQITSERSSAWELFTKQIQNNILNWKNQLNSHNSGYQTLVKLCGELSKPLWKLTKDDIQDDPLFEQYKTYRTNVYNLFKVNTNFKNNQQAQAIFVLLKTLDYSIDEISELDFILYYKPYSFKGDFLPNQLGKIFWDYFVKYRENEIRIWENETKSRNNKVLTEAEFTEIHGDKPWEVASNILSRFSSLDYKITSPEGYSHLDNYQLKLEHIKRDIKVNFSNLSSGERVLMALVASLYKLDTDKQFPDLLLLDEIDASLHPSMIQNMLDVLFEFFINKGIKVILVTHSPTTVALAPENSIFVMNKYGDPRIEKRSNSDALAILTEGFATLEHGIKLFDQLGRKSVSIITEGKNTEYIKKAIEFTDPNILNDIEIITGAENVTGKSQLKTIYQFLQKVPHNTKVLFVWDCDETSSYSEENNTFPYIFGRNDTNKKVTNGIENLFPEALFTDAYYSSKAKPDGGVHISLDKEKFKDYILNNGDASTFALFKPLIDRTKEIINIQL